MTATEERQGLLAQANELGLSFAKNAKLETIKTGIARKRELLGEIEPEEPLGIEESDSLESMREKLEREYEQKLQVRMNQLINEANDATGGINAKAGVEKMRKLREATKLIRCIVTNRNPMKASWEGEIFSVGNDIVGSIKKYVPFGLEEGYHVPQMILNTLKEKECTVFVDKKVNGEKVKVGKLIKEYGIEILDPLTPDELSQLATEQKSRGSID